MEREADGSRNSDAKILAQLRRRSAETSERNAEEYAAETTQGVGGASVSEGRAEALKRLVASNAPKEPMSALSSTLRNLREELRSDDAAYIDSSNASGDAALDLLESELESLARNEATNVTSEPAAATNEETTQVAPESSVGPAIPVSRVEVVEPRQVAQKSRVEDTPSAMSSVADLLVVADLKKGYIKGKKLIPVLQGVNLTVRKGELLAVVGQSGSGKSTLLHLMGTLDVPDSGTIHFDGQRIDNLPSSQRDVLRNRFIGMIFQFYHLIPEMTTLENVLAPLMIRDSIFGYLRKRASYVERAKELLELVGLSHRLRHRPNELSGGEMQRASIARALISEPRVLLADEPTGNLDSKASVGVLELLRKLNDEKNLTIVMVTHDMSQARDADRAIRIVDGLIVKE